MSQPADLMERDEIAEARAFALELGEIWRAGVRRAETSEAEPESEADPTEMLVEDCASEAGEVAEEYALVPYEGSAPAETARAAEVVEIHDSESEPEEEPEEYEPGLALHLHLFNFSLPFLLYRF